jgi:hypothetical protein
MQTILSAIAHTSISTAAILAPGCGVAQGPHSNVITVFDSVDVQPL